MFCACTNETIENFENEVENANSNFLSFEEESKSFHQNPIDYAKFVKSYTEIVEMHIQFDYFCEVLPNNLLAKFQTKNYSVDDAVYGIYIWWLNEETHDVLVEWSVFDDFMVNLPEKYFEKYDFYW